MSSPESHAHAHAHAHAHPLSAEALNELGLDVGIRRFPDETRTAAQAAGGALVDVRERTA
ncbi:hypothetical protein ACGFYP_22060 [Streptomyces sp. NPDC048370]|uniref:hypothetical protein n=1 Tax=Streptomyces sp. NPDC048370 TaxID=3365540 RepID=UPI0037109F80